MRKGIIYTDLSILRPKAEHFVTKNFLQDKLLHFFVVVVQNVMEHHFLNYVHNLEFDEKQSNFTAEKHILKAYFNVNPNISILTNSTVNLIPW